MLSVSEVSHITDQSPHKAQRARRLVGTTQSAPLPLLPVRLAMTRQMQPHQQWEVLCTELNYAPDLRSSGLELLQRLQSARDGLVEGTQVRGQAPSLAPGARGAPVCVASWRVVPARACVRRPARAAVTVACMHLTARCCFFIHVHAGFGPGPARSGGVLGEQPWQVAPGHLRDGAHRPPQHAHEGGPPRRASSGTATPLGQGLSTGPISSTASSTRSPLPLRARRRTFSTTCSSSTRACTRASSSARSSRCVCTPCHPPARSPSPHRSSADAPHAPAMAISRRHR